MADFTLAKRNQQKTRYRIFFRLASILVTIACLWAPIHPARAQSSSAAPYAITLPTQAPITVAVGGPPVVLNWGPPGPNEYFLISTAIPLGDLVWPNLPSGDTPPGQGTYGLYGTTLNAVEVSIPSGSSAPAVGTSWTFTLFTCNSVSEECS